MNKLTILLAPFEEQSAFLISKLLDNKYSSAQRLRFPELYFHFSEIYPIPEKFLLKKAEEIVHLVSYSDVCICTHSSVLFHAFKFLVSEGKIKPDQMETILWRRENDSEEWTEQKLIMSNVVIGQLVDWPKGLFSEICDFICGITESHFNL